MLNGYLHSSLASFVTSNKTFYGKNISLLLFLYYMHLKPKNLVRRVCIRNAWAAYQQNSPLKSIHIISVRYTWGIHIIGMH